MKLGRIIFCKVLNIHKYEASKYYNGFGILLQCIRCGRMKLVSTVGEKIGLKLSGKEGR